LSILVLFGVGMNTKKLVKSTFYELLMCLSSNSADRTGLEPADQSIEKELLIFLLDFLLD